MTTQAKKAGTKSAPAKKSRFSFFPEVIAELRKAHWPTRQEALRLSLLVLVVCAIVGAILGALDWVFTQLFLLLGG
ncbi:MAG: preprotein translocase subunit SecE [Dehalococcoidia bacterium]|jgi:preprotein translocase subunit SecE|nr:MAG: preprotein translocase subunit SecE [Dehalococcoidia bacterium]